MYSKPFHKNDLSQYSFLVTGGAGFIGSNLVEYLLKYKAGKVRTLDNFSTGSFKNIDQFNNQPNFEIIESDIRDLAACQKASQGIDFVLHQAALGSVPRSIKDPLTTNEVNTTGFLNMLIAARDAKVKRFIYATSSSTYGDSITLPKVEDEIGKPLSPYAVTKLVNELFADVFAKLYSLETIGLRYFNVFGPNQNPEGPYAAVIPKFITALLKEERPVIYGDGEQIRDFTFIENAVEANIKAVFTENKSAVNQIYNVAYGKSISVKKVFDILKQATDSKAEPLFEKERIGDIKNSFADISKAKALLGYKPIVNAEDGLKITLNWFKHNGVFVK